MPDWLWLAELEALRLLAKHASEEGKSATFAVRALTERDMHCTGVVESFCEYMLTTISNVGQETVMATAVAARYQPEDNFTVTLYADGLQVLSKWKPPGQEWVILYAPTDRAVAMSSIKVSPRPQLLVVAEAKHF